MLFERTHMFFCLIKKLVYKYKSICVLYWVDVLVVLYKRPLPNMHFALCRGLRLIKKNLYML